MNYLKGGEFLIKESEAKNIFIHDPLVSYWEELDLRVESNVTKLANFDSDIIIICCGHSFYKSERFLRMLVTQ